jgi:hypothetical protein
LSERLARTTDHDPDEEGSTTMQRLAQRHDMALAAAARAFSAYGNGCAAFGSWSMGSDLVIPTTHKAKSPGRSEVIPW